MGGGPHPGAERVRHRHAGRAHDPVHDAAPPSAHARPPQGAARQERAGPWPAAAPWPCGTLSPPRSRPCPRSSGGRSHGTKAPRWRGTRTCASNTAFPSTSAIPRARGSAAQTRTRTACCASTSQRAPISASTDAKNSRRSLPRSIEGRARPSAGTPPQKLWTHTSSPPKMPMSTTG